MDKGRGTATKAAGAPSYSASTVQGDDRETCSPNADPECSQAVQVALRLRGSSTAATEDKNVYDGERDLLHDGCFSGSMGRWHHAEDSVEVYPPARAQAGQGVQTFGFNLVINEDAGLNVAHHFTAGKLVGKVRREGGTGCFIALGLPNSGKTYMMEGDHEQDEPGVVMRAIKELLECGHLGPRIGAFGMKLPPPGTSVAMSHYEVHQEKVYDLLNNNKKVSLKEDDNGCVILDGLSEVHVRNVKGAKQLLGEAASFQRQQGTRSYAHRFTTLYLYKEGGAMPSVMHHSLSGERRVPHAKLTFVDVAGHEPAKDIVSSKLDVEDIAWLYESGHAIQTCLSRHLWLQQAGPKLPLDVPYDISTVTHILKDVFAEGTHLSLCLNASPASKDFRGETLQLLEQLSLPQKPRSVAPFRQQAGPAAVHPQPQHVKQPARPLESGDELSSAPATKRPARDVKRPRAEELLDAAQEEAQRWRAQALRLSQELQSAHSAAHSEHHDIIMQLRGARASPAGADCQVSSSHQDVAAIIRQRDSALEQLLRSKAARAEEAAAAKKAQAELLASSQEATMQLRQEQEARAAAEGRAADLEQTVSAQLVQVQDLEGEKRRIISGRKELRQQFETALEALGECDMDLSASKASNEQAEQLIAQLRTQLTEATAAKSLAEQRNVQLVSQLEAAKTANARTGAELHEARHAGRIAQAAAEKEAQRAADLDASKAAMEQQLDELQKLNKERQSRVAQALDKARQRVQQAKPQREAQRLLSAAPPAPELLTPMEPEQDAVSQATSVNVVDVDEDADAPAAAGAPAVDQAVGGRTAPGTPQASAGGRVPHSACVSAEPPAVLMHVCKALKGVDSRMAAQHATPAKRAREESASLAPAPKLATAPDASSANPQAERRVRRRTASSVAPDKDAAAPTAAAQPQSIAGSTAQISAAAAGPERRPLVAGREQPGAARQGQRRSGAASQIRHPDSQRVTRSVAASRQPPTRLPPVQEFSLKTGAQSSVDMEIEHSEAPVNARKKMVAKKCGGGSAPKNPATCPPVLPPVPECTLATGAKCPAVPPKLQASAAQPHVQRKKPARMGAGPKVPMAKAAQPQWRHV